MPQIPILSGIYADAVADFVESYPVNREPVILKTGLSEGYLRMAPGIAPLAAGPGADRGGINWNGVCYRVLGKQLVSVSPSGSLTVLGDVGEGGRCSFDYSFDRLGIASGGRLYYWNGAALTLVSDPDLGAVRDMIWIDGYFMTTDGESIVVTELNDPTSVDPIKYGSSEVDPDPIVALTKVRGEVYALNRHTIQVFSNVGGNGFPFAENPGGMIPRGVVGKDAKVLFVQSFAYVGSGRNEALGVYIAGAGDDSKISTARIDKALAALSDAEAGKIVVDARVDHDEQRLFVHLPDRTFVFFSTASQLAGKKVWAEYASGVTADRPYRGRGPVLAYGKWIVGDADGNIGELDGSISTHFGEVAGWRFDTALIYNETGRGIINAVEIVGLPGRAPIGSDPRIFMSTTTDGVTWGQERAISPGRIGDRDRRMQWRPGRRFNNWIGMRFRGADNGMAAFARLDAAIEPMGG